MPDVICPECGAPMVLRTTKRFTYRNGQLRKFWGCSRWPECDGTHGAHPDGRPLGFPADKATKRARMEAHQLFDAWWKSGVMSRPQAYVRLQQLMGLSEEDAHISRFTKERCAEFVRRNAEDPTI